MTEENISQQFRLKNIDETRNHLIVEINWNELISKERKKICKFLNCIEHFLILDSAVTWCVSISAFASLADTAIGISSSSLGLKFCVINAAVKKYRSIIKKKKKKQNKNLDLII